MKIVCDTNFWYDSAKDPTIPQKVRALGYKLLATPTNYMEIVSKINDQTFQDRKNAAATVLKYADHFLEDTERYLARIMRIQIEDIGIDWRDGFIAITMSESAQDLVNGVPDHAAGVTRTVNIPLLLAWRRLNYDFFCAQGAIAIESEFPGYIKRILKDNPKYMPEEFRNAFGKKVMTEGFLDAIFDAMKERVLMHAAPGASKPKDEDVGAARQRFDVYLRMYQLYLFRLGTKFIPDENDFGDLDLFTYVADDTHFCSSDDRWLTLANDAGFGNRVVDIKAL